MDFGLSLELIQKLDDLASFLEGVLVVLLLFSQEQVASDASQDFPNHCIVYKVEQLRLDLWGEDHVELGQITNRFLVCYSHLLLLRSNVLQVSGHCSISLKRLDLGVDGIEPFLKIEVGLGLQNEWPRLIFNF